VSLLLCSGMSLFLFLSRHHGIECMEFVISGDGMEVASASTIPLKFRIGEKVRVDLDVEVLKAMQEGHGGWHPKMADVSTCAINISVYILYLDVSCTSCEVNVSILLQQCIALYCVIVICSVNYLKSVSIIYTDHSFPLQIFPNSMGQLAKFHGSLQRIFHI